MKQLARRASLVVVLLLASVGTASAECAWVLWNAVGGGGVARGAALPWMPFDSSRALKIVKQQEKEMRSFRAPTAWVCLPDTIDPRGPKGK